MKVKPFIASELILSDQKEEKEKILFGARMKVN